MLNEVLGRLLVEILGTVCISVGKDTGYWDGYRCLPELPTFFTTEIISGNLKP